MNRPNKDGPPTGKLYFIGSARGAPDQAILVNTTQRMRRTQEYRIQVKNT